MITPEANRMMFVYIGFRALQRGRKFIRTHWIRLLALNTNLQKSIPNFSIGVIVLQRARPQS